MDLVLANAPAMIQCQNCGKSNTPESQFCRYCGHRFGAGQPQPEINRPPRPYSWQTDEYQTQSEPRSARKTVGHVELPKAGGFQATPNYGAIQHSYHGPQDLSGNYRCPSCGTNFLPVLERRISTAGWITFALLLVFTFIFFWIGLLLKEEVPICPVCRHRVY